MVPNYNAYKEIFRLRALLLFENIPHDFDAIFDGFCIVVTLPCGAQIDAVEHNGSYGHEKDLLEIMGALTAEEGDVDDVLGYLSAGEVFRRFKYCYEHNTPVYCGD